MNEKQLAVKEALIKLIVKKEAQLDRLYKDAEMLLSKTGKNTHKTNSYLRATMAQIEYIEMEINSIQADIDNLDKLY